MKEMDAQTKVSRSVIKLAVEQPFYGSLLMSSNLTKEEGLPTMATDGSSVFWGPDFVDDITEEETKGVLVHELWHIIFLHCQRPIRKTKNPSKEVMQKCRLWNMAEDYVINIIVIDEGFQLPEGTLYNEKYRDWSAEQVFEDIVEDPKHQEMAESWTDDVYELCNPDGSPMSQAEAEAAGLEIAQKMVTAAEAAKNCGKAVSGKAREMIDNIRKPKVDWKAFIRNWVKSQHPMESTWSRPNRKLYGAYDIYAPTMHGTKVGEMAVIIDTSASVGKTEREAFLAELNAIMEDLRPEQLHILNVDTEVASCQSYDCNDDLSSIELTGGGGTDMEPGFRYIRECLPDAEHVLCFSDLEFGGQWPEQPEQEVLWLSTSEEEAPYGTVIKINVE